MKFTQLKQLSTLPETEMTAKFIRLAQEILRCHDAGLGFLVHPDSKAEGSR